MILQRIREAEREMMFEEYQDRVGELITGIIQQSDNRYTLVQLRERVEALLPRSEQVWNERYDHGMRVKAVITDVSAEGKGPSIVVSRRNPELIKKLFELEVPEIADELVEIVGVAREPGYRSKIAVISHADGVDPVGACVGPRGSRVRMVVSELRGEKIDIIPYNEEPARFVAKALSPARVREVLVDDEDKQATVIVPDDQLSLAIGREGQNARLAAKLTGWRVDIKSETEFCRGRTRSRSRRPSEADGRCAAVLSAGRRCPNASLPGSRYCGLPQHQALARFATNQVTVLAPLTEEEVATLADSDADEAAVAAARRARRGRARRGGRGGGRGTEEEAEERRGGRGDDGRGRGGRAEAEDAEEAEEAEETPRRSSRRPRSSSRRPTRSPRRSAEADEADEAEARGGAEEADASRGGDPAEEAEDGRRGRRGRGRAEPRTADEAEQEPRRRSSLVAKKRVHEIAKAQGLTSKEVLAALNAAGVEAKAAASSVEEDVALKALKAPTAAAPKPPAKAAGEEGRGRSRRQGRRRSRAAEAAASRRASAGRARRPLRRRAGGKRAPRRDRLAGLAPRAHAAGAAAARPPRRRGGRRRRPLLEEPASRRRAASRARRRPRSTPGATVREVAETLGARQRRGDQEADAAGRDGDADPDAPRRDDRGARQGASTARSRSSRAAEEDAEEPELRGRRRATSSTARRWSRSWATSTTARPRCSTRSARPRSSPARPAGSPSTSAPTRSTRTARRSRFIDTPGHEAFTAMRARGAKVTDIAVIVVAADDGVMPQTVEAIDHAKAADVPMMVAVNKIDQRRRQRPTRSRASSPTRASTPRTGAATRSSSTSRRRPRRASTTCSRCILLVAELEELKANPDAPASGTVIESHLDPGRGPVVTRAGPARHAERRRRGRRRARSGAGCARCRTSPAPASSRPSPAIRSRCSASTASARPASASRSSRTSAAPASSPSERAHRLKTEAAGPPPGAHGHPRGGLREGPGGRDQGAQHRPQGRRLGLAGGAPGRDRQGAAGPGRGQRHPRRAPAGSTSPT